MPMIITPMARRGSLLCLCMVAVAAHAFGAEPPPQDSLSSKPDFDFRQRQYIRTCLARGDYKTAKKQLRLLRDQADFVSPLVDVETTSFLAVVAENVADTREAQRLFRRAAAAADQMNLVDLSTFLGFAELAVRPPPKPLAGPASLAFLSTYAPMAAAMLAIDPAPPQAPNHDLSAAALHQLVRPARTAFATDATLENKIALLTALILFAEVASRPEEQLYSDANMAFHEGLTLLAEVKSDLAGSPDEDRLLSENRALAVRFDVVRFREAKIREKSFESLKQDRVRTERLQTLVLAYRDAAGEYASAMAAHLASDTDRSIQSLDSALTQLQTIQDIVGEQRDFYLLTAEPANLQGEGRDDEILYNPASPFSPRLTSESLVIRGLSQFRTQPQSPATIDRALRDVSNALSDNAAGDPGNTLGHYAAAVMHEARGDLLLAEAPTDPELRKRAATDFSEAETLLRQAADKAKGVLRDDIAERRSHLAAPRDIVAESIILTNSGKTDAATELLEKGTRRFDDADLWARWAASASRSGEDRTEIRRVLEAAVRNGVVDEATPLIVLSRARVAIEQVVADTAASLEELSAQERQTIADGLTHEISRLRAAASTLDGDTQAMCHAYHGLAEAYRLALLRGQDVSVRDATEAYSLCKKSHEVLLTAVAKTPHGGDTADLNEALIAARLALGYLATTTVPGFQDEALAAFAGALDQQSRLSGQQSLLKMTGSPFVAALRDRPADALAESARYEQSLRRSMVSLLDGILSLHFGRPEAAADFLDAGLTRLQSEGGSAEHLPNAARLFTDSDTFEMEVLLKDFFAVFAVLAEVDSGRPRDALLTALERLAPDVSARVGGTLHTALTPEDLDGIAQTGSPLALYAIARALEAYVLSLELSPDQQHTSQALLQQARSAIDAAKNTTTPWIASRYPAFVSLVNQSEARFAGPDSYLEQVRQLRAQGRLEDAVALLREAVRLYRANPSLWLLWVEIELTRVAAITSGANQPSDADSLELLADVISDGQANGAFSASDAAYFSAVLADRLGKNAEAVAQYSASLRNDDLLPLFRVRAKARLAALNLDLSLRYETN